MPQSNGAATDPGRAAQAAYRTIGQAVQLVTTSKPINSLLSKIARRLTGRCSTKSHASPRDSANDCQTAKQTANRNPTTTNVSMNPSCKNGTPLVWVTETQPPITPNPFKPIDRPNTTTYARLANTANPADSRNSFRASA